MRTDTLILNEEQIPVTTSFNNNTLRLARASADPEGGQGVWTPPWKITSYMGFYRE